MMSFRSCWGKIIPWLSSIPTLTNFPMRLWRFFLSHLDVKEMQERWNKLMVLVFLGALRPQFSKTWSNVIDSFTTSHLRIPSHPREAVPLESQNPTIGEIHDRSALAVQGRRKRGRGRGSNFRARGCGGGCSGGRAKRVIYCYYCKESYHTKHNCPLLQGKQQLFRSAHVSIAQEEQFDTRSCVKEEHMKEQLYQIF